MLWLYTTPWLPIALIVCGCGGSSAGADTTIRTTPGLGGDTECDHFVDSVFHCFLDAGGEPAQEPTQEPKW